MNWFSNLCLAVANYFGWAKDRQALKNAPAVQKAATAVSEQKEEDRLKRAIAAGDDEAIRKAVSE